jgi:hypothetical protein
MAFVFLRRRFYLKCAEISSSARLGIFLPRIQSILFRFKLPDHDSVEYSQTKRAPRVGLYGNRLSRRFKTRRRSGPYKDLGERFETQSTTSAARIARLVAR